MTLDSYVYPGPRFTQGGHVTGQGQGITLRDAAALAALPALIARHRADVAWGAVGPRAYEIADAFIAARNVEGATP